MKMTYLQNIVTLRLNTDKCNGCGMCVKVCPHRVFEMINGKASLKHFNYCMECGACALNCAKDAIYVKSGVGCAAGILQGILKNTEPTCGCSSEKSNICN